MFISILGLLKITGPRIGVEFVLVSWNGSTFGASGRGGGAECRSHTQRPSSLPKFGGFLRSHRTGKREVSLIRRVLNIPVSQQCRSGVK